MENMDLTNSTKASQHVINSPKSKHYLEKGSSDKIDNVCKDMTTWCWPCPPKRFCGPCKYTKDTLCEIPTGSLYIASRKGPLAEMNAKITGCPYDMIGIIFQSKANNKEGTYLYTVDTKFVKDGYNKVTVIDMLDLIKDDNIIFHGALPLKDFDDKKHCKTCSNPRSYAKCKGGTCPKETFCSTKGMSDMEIDVCVQCHEDCDCNGKYEHTKCELCDCHDTGQSDTDEKGMSDKSDVFCPDCHEECECKGKKKHNDCDKCHCHDDQVSKCWDSADDCHDDCECKGEKAHDTCDKCRCYNSEPSEESSSTTVKSKCKSKRNCCVVNKEYLRNKRNETFKHLFKKYRNLKPEHDAYQALASIVGLPVAESLRTKNSFTAPELVGLILYQAGFTWDARFGSKTKNPACCYDEEFFKKLAERCNEKGSNDETDILLSMVTPKYHTNREYKQVKGEDHIEMVVDEKGSEDVKLCDTDCDQKCEVKGCEEPVSLLHNKHFCPTDKESVLDDVKDNLKNYMESKNYYTSKDDYRRCVYPSNWPNSSLDSCSEEDDACKPKKKEVYARTIMFGSLRVVDFLNGYYRAEGIDTNDHDDLKDLGCMYKYGRAGLSAAIHSLASFRSKEKYDFNDLNMVWYHDNIVPIELCNNKDADCKKHFKEECKVMERLATKLDQDYIQKRMLHQDKAILTSKKLHHICKKISELATELHSLACEVGSNIKHDDKKCRAKDYSDQEDCEKCDFNIKLKTHDKCTNEYYIVVDKYMWGEWKYYWKHHMECNASKYYHLKSRAKRVVKDLYELKNRTPVTCILLELIVRMYKQAVCIFEYIDRSKDYCLKDKQYDYSKGSDKNVDVLIEGTCSEETMNK